MEQQFKTQRLSCLEPVVKEVRTAEQVQEIKLPDSLPDVGRIIAAWGQGILRSKEWRSRDIGLSCGVMVWVLYAPEDGSRERCVDTWVPLQMKWDLPDMTAEGTMRMMACPRFVDARSVSPRKIMVRVGMSAMAEAWVPLEMEVSTPEGKRPDVELLESTYPVRLSLENGEKSFLFEEELTLPASAPVPEELIYYHMEPSLTDKRVLGNKVVFRGNGNLHVLYRSEEGQLHSWDFELPFSQYQELEGEYGTDAMADILLSPTNLELGLDEEGHMHLRSSAAAQYVISDQQLLRLAEDAYSPGRELKVQTREITLPVILEHRRENLWAEQTIPAEANLTADVRFLPELPRQRAVEAGVELEVPGLFQVLYYGEDGLLRAATARWTGSSTLRADSDSQITAIPLSAQPQATAGSGQIHLKAELPMELTAAARQSIPMVTEAEPGEAIPPDPDRPSLILRRAGEDRLWDLARASGSTVEAICRANDLKAEPEPGQLLLIPVK